MQFLCFEQYKIQWKENQSIFFSKKAIIKFVANYHMIRFRLTLNRTGNSMWLLCNCRYLRLYSKKILDYRKNESVPTAESIECLSGSYPAILIFFLNRLWGLGVFWQLIRGDVHVKVWTYTILRNFLTPQWDGLVIQCCNQLIS